MTKEDRTAVAFLFGVAALYFVPVLLKGDREVLSSVGTDIWAAYFYWRHFGFESLARGEIPLWNPHSFSGIPFVAGMESAIFYPPNLIYLFFGTAFSINLSIALHCFLGSLFTYVFARTMNIDRAGALLAALTFAYGAPCFLRVYAGHVVGLAALIWLPLLFLAAEAFLRNGEMRFALWGGVILAMQLLAGQPQYVFYSMIAVSLYFFSNLLIGRKLREAPYFFTGFCLFVIAGLLLAAIQLLPTLELARHSVRNALGYEWISTFSFPPENLLTLALPDVFGDLLTAPYWGKNYLWEMSIYLGIVPVAMGAIAIVYDRSRPAMIFSFLAAVALVFALGKHTPALGFLYAYVPGFNLFRGVSKFIVVFSFAWSMLAGYGFMKLTALAEAKDRGFFRLSWIIPALAVALACVGALAAFRTADSQAAWNAVVKSYDRGVDDYSFGAVTGNFLPASLGLVFQDVFRAAAVLLVLGGLLLSFAKRATFPKKLFIVAVLTLTALDLWSFGSRYLVSFNPRILYMDRDLRAFLKSDREPFRLATPIDALLNVGFLEGTKEVGGYDQLTLKDYNEFINFSQGLPLDKPNFVMVVDRFSPMLRLLNARYYILDNSVKAALPDFKLVFQNAKYNVYRDEKSLPRSYVVHAALVIKEREAALQAMADPTFNPASAAIVDEEIGGLTGDPKLRSPTPTVIEDLPKKIALEANLKAAGLLILADAYYPGWKGFVDGKETRIYRVNHAMRGVVLPKGEHRVEFRYEPFSFKIGAVISMASLISVVGILMWPKFKLQLR